MFNIEDFKNKGCSIRVKSDEELQDMIIYLKTLGLDNRYPFSALTGYRYAEASSIYDGCLNFGSFSSYKLVVDFEDIIASTKGGKVMNKNNKSEGIFTDQMMEKMGIERVLINDVATIVFLKDGRKGTSVQSSADESDRAIGLAMAYAYAVGTDGNKTQFRNNVEQVKKHAGFGKNTK